jgi:hypothetical protein
MTDEVQVLVQQVAAAEEEYMNAIKRLSEASTELRKLKKEHLETAARAAGWKPGIFVIGKLKPHDRVPQSLWGLRDRKRDRVRGIYMGCLEGTNPSNDPVLDIRWISSKMQPRKDMVPRPELYDWHRVIDVPKED